MLFQLGSALLAAAIVRIYFDGGFGWKAIIWLLIATAIILGGWMMLGLLDVEQ